MPHRRAILKTGGALIAGGTLAGCRSLQRNARASSDGNPGSSTSTAHDVPNDLFEGETLKVGGAYPIPSDYPVGRDAKRGTELAVREHNRSANGVLGGEVQHLPRDTGISPAQGRKITRELIVDNGVDVVNGGFLGTTYKQMLEPIANNQTLSFFSGGASVPVAKKIAGNFQRYKYSFRTLLNMAQARNAELNFLEWAAPKMDWDKIAVFTENLAVYDAVAGSLVQGIRDRNIAEVPIAKRTSQSIINWNPLFDQAEQANCDLVLVNLVLTGITAARQWGTQERPFDFGGIHLQAMADGFWKSVGRSTPGLWTLTTGAPDSDQNPRTIPMMNRFEKEFGYRTSTYFAYSAYDAINIWVDAMKQVGSKSPEDIIPYLEERTWNNSVWGENQRFRGPDDKWPHDWYIPPADDLDLWLKKSWPIAVQWKGEKGGKGSAKTVAPPGAVTGDVQLRHAPWLQK